MKLAFLKEDNLLALKVNLKDNLNCYKNSDNDWLYDYFQGNDPFMEYKTDVTDFELTCNQQEDVGKQDLENVIRLYSSMKNISDTQATEERLWSGLCHGQFYSYVYKRWEMGKKENIDLKSINTRYFFGQNKKRSLITNTLSKLWWVGRLTYDEERKDPFELTRYLENDFSTKVLVIFSNNYMSNPVIAKGLLSALLELEQSGFMLKGRLKRDIYYEATKYLNILGGIYILDYFFQEEIKEKIIKYMKGLN